MKPERKKWVDVLKGIAIILVVLQHSCGSLYNSGLYMKPIFPVIIHGIGIFHMALFMELSGFVFYEAYIKNEGIDSRRVRDQIINLSIIYVVFSVLRFLTKSLFVNEANYKIAPGGFFTIPIKALDELWFLYALIIIYFVCFWLFTVNKAVLIIATFMISVLICVSGISSEYTVVSGIHYACFFLMGAWYSKNKAYLKGSTLKKSIKTATLILLIVVYNTTVLDEYIGYFIELMMAFVICDLLIIYCRRLDERIGESHSFILRALEYFGEHTLPIYLLHVYFTAGLRPFVRYLNLISCIPALLMLCVTGIIAPLIIYQILKMIRLDKLAFYPYKFIKERI